MKKNYVFQAGFTLIELMITIAIAAILLSIAVPSLSAYKRSSELNSATSKLISAINAARSEAMKHGRNAMLVPTANGNSWNTGWVVFVDKDRSQAFEAPSGSPSADIIVATENALPTYINVASTGTGKDTPAYIMFNASGYSIQKNTSSGNLTMTITRTDVNATPTFEETRYIKIANTGRVRSCKPTSATDPNCKLSSVS